MTCWSDQALRSADKVNGREYYLDSSEIDSGGDETVRTNWFRTQPYNSKWAFTAFILHDTLPKGKEESLPKTPFFGTGFHGLHKGVRQWGVIGPLRMLFSPELPRGNLSSTRDLAPCQEVDHRRAGSRPTVTQYTPRRSPLQWLMFGRLVKDIDQAVLPMVLAVQRRIAALEFVKRCTEQVLRTRRHLEWSMIPSLASLTQDAFILLPET